MNRYLAITPARDEETLIGGLIESMTGQTCRPERWIIIDDGSCDATGEIIDEAARRHRWIQPHHLDRNRPREAGGESVVMQFLPPAVWTHYDFILRLDADLGFEADFAQLLLAEFARDPTLGIASATLLEPGKKRWHKVRVPSFHTRGAVKLYSRECFAAIGGLDSGLGWDTIDEAHAMMLGFRTRSFEHIHAYHYRPQGAAGGLLRGRWATGRAAYRAGYSPIFMLARAAHQALEWPFVLGGIAVLLGYWEGYLRRWPPAASPELVRFVRKQQIRRLLMLDSVWH